MLIKKLTLFVCLLFVFSMSSMYSYAESASDAIGSGITDNEKVTATRFTYIIYTNTYLGIADGVANSLASVSCDYDTTESCTATAYLQRRPIGSTSWSTICTYFGSGSFHASATGSRNVASGYEYRVKARYTATGKDGGSETTYSYSKIVTVN